MAVVKIVLKTNRKQRDNSYPVCIRITVRQKVTFIRLHGFNAMDKKDFNNDLGRFTRRKQGYRELNKYLSDIDDRAAAIKERLEVENRFSADNFKRLYFEDNTKETVFSAFTNKIDLLKSEYKYSSAKRNQDTLKSLRRYTNDISFNDIDFRFLRGYYRYLSGRGLKQNTMATYFRTLRALHYEHCKVNDKPYPNAYRQLSVRAEKTKNRALTKEQFTALQEYKPTETEEKYLDMFFISYHLHGANLKDIAKLTKANINAGRIEYRRSKTGHLFSIKINDKLKYYLDKYQCENSDYLFPILRGSKSNVHDRVSDWNRRINRYLKRIAMKLNIEEGTFYSARYTFVAFLMDNDVPIQYIQQLMGHASISTTQVYMKKFSNKKLDEVAETIYDI